MEGSSFLGSYRSSSRGETRHGRSIDQKYKAINFYKQVSKDPAKYSIKKVSSLIETKTELVNSFDTYKYYKRSSVYLDSLGDKD